MSAPLRILFIGYFQYNSGSSHALLGYVRVAQDLGYDLRASKLGLVDDIVKEKVPVADEDWIPDIVVLIFESKQFLSESAISKVERLTTHAHTLVIDPDGKYSDAICSESDTNHPTADSRAFWTSYYHRFTNTVLQPYITSTQTKAKKFLYFGINTQKYSSIPLENNEKPFDLIYIGNNWYRWHDFIWLFEELKSVRNKLGRIAVFGKHWFGDPKKGLEQFTYSDPGYLTANNIESYRSVPFDEVEKSMGLGKLHPIFIRPVLNALELATPRMFETFAAETVPILPPYFTYAEHLYGKRVIPLFLTKNPANVVINILENYQDYVCLSKEIRSVLVKEHSYKIRLAELLGFCLTFYL